MNTPNLFVIAKITLKPEFFATGKDAILGIIPNTRAESGCVQFELHEDVEQNTLFLYEEWIDQSALDSHYAQEYTKTVFANYSDWLSKPIEISKLTKLEA